MGNSVVAKAIEEEVYRLQHHCDGVRADESRHKRQRALVFTRWRRHGGHEAGILEDFEARSPDVRVANSRPDRIRS